MPILLECRCGKQLRLKNEAAGQHIRCPQCGHVLLVPAQPDNTAEEPSPDDFLRSLSQGVDAPSPPLSAMAAHPPADQASTEQLDPTPPQPSEPIDHGGAPPEIPFRDMPFSRDDASPNFTFAAADRLNRHDRTARVGVLVLRIFAWLGLAGAMLYVLITVAGILLVSASAEPDVRTAATALSGILGLGFILATLAGAALWWALLIALASITENLIEIRRRSRLPQTPGPGT